MMKRGSKRWSLILRRGLALGLTLSALWVTVRTFGITDSGQALRALSEDASFAISLLRLQMPACVQDPQQDWLQLVLAQSPLLRASPRATSEQTEPQPPLPDPPLPDSSSEDGTEPPITVDGENTNIIARTMIPSASQTYLRAGDIYIANRANKQADAAALASAPVNITLSDGPQILILHTHGSEAYTPAGTDTYIASDPYRTTDCNNNVVRVGEEIAQVFRTHGLQVLHDTNLYDYPSYNGAYSRSGAAVERWLAQYPSIQVILDVHRDALEGGDGVIYKVVSDQSDGQTAQVMLVVGTDGTGSAHPLWRENLTFAMRLQEQMLTDHQTLPRPIVLRSSGFNQQFRVGSLLLEVGTHGNTLQEAIAGARLFAQSACKVLEGLH